LSTYLVHFLPKSGKLKYSILLLLIAHSLCANFITKENSNNRKLQSTKPFYLKPFHEPAHSLRSLLRKLASHSLPGSRTSMCVSVVPRENCTIARDRHSSLSFPLKFQREIFAGIDITLCDTS
jgi:hypothetical protein